MKGCFSTALAVLASLSLGSVQAQAHRPADTQPKKPKQSKPAKQKGSASAGRSAPPAFVPDPAYDASYKQSDMDGDGEISKAEAAGNEPLVIGFHRADRNQDGKLNRREYEALFHAKEKADARARAKEEAREKAKADDAASAGASGLVSR